MLPYSEGVGVEGPRAKEKFDLNLVSKNKIHQHIHVPPYSEGVGAEEKFDLNLVSKK